VKRLFAPVPLGVLALVLLGVAAYGYVAPTDEYIYLPDRARPLAPLVAVPGERRSSDDGGIYFVTVDVRRATKLEELFPGLHDGATLVDAPCVSEEESRQGARSAMERSQRIAAAVALRELGYRIPHRRTGAVVVEVGCDVPASGRLRSGDVLAAADGRPVRSPDDLRRVIGLREVGESVRLRVRRGKRTHEIVVGTVGDPAHPERPIVGIIAAQAVRIRLPVAVRIDLGRVGGPSAGLAFGLDLLEELGRDVDRGYRVAATGELALDGTVLPVGGVKQKTIGARRADVDVFVVPAGENAAEARRYADELRIVPVRTFQQALRRLATLPARD
jgi:PDZ domain-containing protein